MPAAIFTPAQEKQIRQQVRKGADLPGLLAFVEKKGWEVSRAKLGQLLKDERSRMRDGAGAVRQAPATLEEVAELVMELQARIDSVQAQVQATVTGLISLPKIKLSDALTAAVTAAHTRLADPQLDPNAAAKIMGEMKGLAEAIARAREMERDWGDDDIDEDLSIE